MIHPQATQRSESTPVYSRTQCVAEGVTGQGPASISSGKLVRDGVFKVVPRAPKVAYFGISVGARPWAMLFPVTKDASDRHRFITCVTMALRGDLHSVRCGWR